MKNGETADLVLQKRTFIAPVIAIAEQQPNDLYLVLKMRMLSTKPNVNNDMVTESFIDDIVGNQEKYRCIPQVADVRKMESRDFDNQTHLQDPRTGVFYTQEIGSFYSFEKVHDEHGVSLVGTARVSKRNHKVIAAILEMFEDGKLFFSFEIVAKEISIANGIRQIDVAEGNYLMGMAVVSMPACTEAKALSLVAEQDRDKVKEDILSRSKSYLGLTAEVSVDTMRQWVWKMAVELVGDMVYEMEFERLCVDCCIMYHVPTGRTFKVEYIIRDEGLVMTDVYEVAFTRKAGDYSMKEENKGTSVEQVAEVVEEPQVETDIEVKAEEVETDVAEETETAETESTEEQAEQEEAVNASTEEEIEIDTLRSRVLQLEALLEERDRVLAELKGSEKVSKAKAIAEKYGLSLEEDKVKQAIASADFEALSLMFLGDPSKTVSASAKEDMNPFVSDLKLGGQDGYLRMFEVED